MSNEANKAGNEGAGPGAGSGTESRAATRERGEEKPTPPQWWNVVLLDDDDHTYEYVIRMVTTLFRVSKVRALELATKVDNEGLWAVTVEAMTSSSVAAKRNILGLLRLVVNWRKSVTDLG